jgi:hypothetical protein
MNYRVTDGNKCSFELKNERTGSGIKKTHFSTGYAETGFMNYMN